MSELATHNSCEQEWHKAQTPRHAEQHDTHYRTCVGNAFCATTLLRSHPIAGRGNGPQRAALINGLQQTHGNRAVQRAVHAPSATYDAPLRAVQRDDFTSTSDDEEFMSLADEGVCYPEEEGIFGTNVPAMTPALTPNTGEATPPIPPGLDPAQAAMWVLQQKKQRESLMTSILTNIANMKHESLKQISTNLRG